MIKQIIAGIAMMACVLAVADARKDATSPEKLKREARAKFENANGGLFAGNTVVDKDASCDELRFDAPDATGSWTIVLPYSDDSRVRFIDVEFKDGKYTKGTIKVFGLRPSNLTEEEFESLRENFPMIAVKRTAVLYPAKTASAAVSGKACSKTLNPALRQLGALSGALGRLKLDGRSLAYEVSFKSADGWQTTIDVCRGADKGGTIKGAKLSKAIIKGLEESDSDREGRVSRRDIVDCWNAGEISLKGVK